jgi:AcrR family transcriptional regulator
VSTQLKQPHQVAARQRARSPEDKDLRRTQLIDAATQLFADADFDAVTVAHVAERAGVAKGTAYLYFATKEALFLELVREALAQWMLDLTERLRRIRSARAVPQAIAKSLSEQRDLRRLLVLLHSVIEPHLDEATARSFKIFMRDLLADVSALIMRKIPGLTLADTSTLVLQTHALVISLTQLAEPPAVIAQVMATDPSLHSMQIDFEPFLASTLMTLVNGMLYNK